MYISQLTEHYMRIPGPKRGNYNVSWKIHSFIHSFPAAFLGLEPDAIWRHGSNQEHNVLAPGQKFYYGKKQQQVETYHGGWEEGVKRTRLRANQHKIKWTTPGPIFCFCFSAQHLLRLLLQSTNLINIDSTQQRDVLKYLILSILLFAAFAEVLQKVSSFLLLYFKLFEAQ